MALVSSVVIHQPEEEERLSGFGFRFTGGAHISKTMMLNEITKLLMTSPPNATIDCYYTAVVRDNILGKGTQSTRQETYSRLRSLYGLDDKIPVFAIYRNLVLFDRTSAPLLSLLVSWIRDPLLRSSTPAIFSTVFGDIVSVDKIRESIQDVFPETYSPSSLGTTSRNVASTWSQSGHLSGKRRKTRTRVVAKPASVTLALILGDICGFHGEHAFTSSYCRLLDLNPIEAKALASQAHRENLLDFKAIGSIVEVSFRQHRQYLEMMW